MKTTIELEDSLLLAAKQRALDTGATLRQVVEQALTLWLKPVQFVQVPIRTVVFNASKNAVPPSAKLLQEAAYDFDTRMARRLGLDEQSESGSSVVKGKTAPSGRRK